MTRRELESLRPGEEVRINYGVGTVIRVDVEKDLVVVSYGGQAWFRDRKVVNRHGRGSGFGISVHGGRT